MNLLKNVKSLPAHNKAAGNIMSLPQVCEYSRPPSSGGMSCVRRSCPVAGFLSRHPQVLRARTKLQRVAFKIKKNMLMYGLNSTLTSKNVHTGKGGGKIHS